MKVLFTGATGFVGSALLSHLVANQVDITALLRNESVRLPDGVNSFKIDLETLAQSADFSFISKSNQVSDFQVEMKHIDVVVHVAARAHILCDDSVDPLAEYRKVNCDATLNLARLAAEAGVKRFVFISSIGVNGSQSTTPFTEGDSVIPHDPYSVSKFEAEQGLLGIAKESDLEVVIIRPPLVYGPNAPGNFASLVKWVKKGVPLPLGAIHNKRSFIALDNLVDFILLCSDRKASPKAANQLFLISDGEDVSTSDLLKKVANAYDVTPRLFSVPVALMTFFAKLLGKPNVASSLFGNLQVNNNKAHDLLGWKPVTTMDRQLSKMAELERGKLSRGQ